MREGWCTVVRKMSCLQCAFRGLHGMPTAELDRFTWLVTVTPESKLKCSGSFANIKVVILRMCAWQSCSSELTSSSFCWMICNPVGLCNAIMAWLGLGVS